MSFVDEKYEGIIGGSVVTTAGIAVPGLFVPALDMAGVGATWTVMIGAIAEKSDREISPETVAKLVAAAVSAVSGYVLGSKILTWLAAPLIMAFPVAGVPAAVAVNAALNGLFTLRLGLACVSNFSRPDFNALDLANFIVSLAGLMAKWPSSEEIAFVQKMLGR
jgi:hypothetical protein